MITYALRSKTEPNCFMRPCHKRSRATSHDPFRKPRDNRHMWVDIRSDLRVWEAPFFMTSYPKYIYKEARKHLRHWIEAVESHNRSYSVNHNIQNQIAIPCARQQQDFFMKLDQETEIIVLDWPHIFDTMALAKLETIELKSVYPRNISRIR